MYAPAVSAWTSWAPTSTSVPASASATAASDTNGGQMTRVTPGTAVAAAMATASGPASAGVVFIFQLPATITGRIAGIIRSRGPRARPSAQARGGARVRSRGRPCARSARWTRAERPMPSGGQLAERRLGSARGARRDGALERRQVVPARPLASSSLDRRELARAAAHRAAEVGGLGVEDAVEVTVELARDEARLELEDARLTRRTSAGTRGSLGALDRSRRRARGGPATERASPASARRLARPAPRPCGDDELEVRAGRPRGSATRARGTGPRSQAMRQCRRAVCPVEGALGARAPSPRRRPRAGPRAARRPASAPGRPRPRRGPARSASAAAGARRLDRGELGAHGLRRARDRGRSGTDAERASGAVRVRDGRPGGPLAARRGARTSASASSAGSCRCALRRRRRPARTTRGGPPPGGQVDARPAGRA